MLPKQGPRKASEGGMFSLNLKGCYRQVRGGARTGVGKSLPSSVFCALRMAVQSIQRDTRAVLCVSQVHRQGLGKGKEGVAGASGSRGVHPGK